MFKSNIQQKGGDNQIYINQTKVLLVLFLYIISIIFFMTDISVETYSYSSYGLYSVYISLILSFLNMVRNSKRIFLFFIFFFLFLFPFDFYISYLAEIPLITVYKLEEVPFIFFIFNLFQVTCLFISKAKESFDYRSIEFLRSKSVYWLLLLVLLIGVVYLKGSNIFLGEGTYKAYTDNLKDASGLNEYLLIFSIFILFFKKNKIERLIFIIILILYVVKSISFGFRVQSIMGILIIGVCFAKKDPSKSLIWFSALFGFFCILLFGFLKEGADVSKLGLKLLVDDRYGYAQSHQHGVLCSSSSVLKRYSFREPVDQILDIPSTILPSTLPRRLIGSEVPRVYPSAFVQQFEYTPGGVLFLVHIYVLIGWGGLVVGTLSFCVICSTFNKTSEVCTVKEKFSAVIIVTLFVFFVRWISYDFFNYGIRTLFIISVLFILYNFISKLSSKGIKNNV